MQIRENHNLPLMKIKKLATHRDAKKYSSDTEGLMFYMNFFWNARRTVRRTAQKNCKDKEPAFAALLERSRPDQVRTRSFDVISGTTYEPFLAKLSSAAYRIATDPNAEICGLGQKMTISGPCHCYYTLWRSTVVISLGWWILTLVDKFAFYWVLWSAELDSAARFFYSVTWLLEPATFFTLFAQRQCYSESNAVSFCTN